MAEMMVDFEGPREKDLPSAAVAVEGWRNGADGCGSEE
jgi:hypothetical protein